MKNTLLIIGLLFGILPVYGQIEQEVRKRDGEKEVQEIEKIDSIRFDVEGSEMEIKLREGGKRIYRLEEILEVGFVGGVLGMVSTLDCAGANIFGDLIENVKAVDVSISIAYTGGNGGPYDDQSISSTGVLGLTASLSAGEFNVGAGSVVLEIGGTALSSGVAVFVLELGGQSCEIELEVKGGEVTDLDCGVAVVEGEVVEGVEASGVTVTVSYTGGNGGPYDDQSISSTGVLGLTASLSAGEFNVGAGSVVLEIGGTALSSGVAVFVLELGGQSCEIELEVKGGEVTDLDCGVAVVEGEVVEGVEASGVTVTVSYTGGNGGPYDDQSISSTGVLGLTASLSAGEFNVGAGSVVLEIGGTALSSGVAVFVLELGGKTCEIEVEVFDGKIEELDCTAAVVEGYLEQGAELDGINVIIQYKGGNGMGFGKQQFQSINSGLTVTLEAGVFSEGDSILNLVLGGVSCEAGTAVFALAIGGQECELQLEVQEGEPFTLQSFFSEYVIPAGIDPVFWYIGPDTLTELKYYANGLEVAGTDNFQLIPNPGVDFSIHATAVVGGVCPVVSDTLQFQVKEFKSEANGYFDPEGAFSLEEVWVYSSLDSAVLDSSRTFQLELSTLMVTDLIYAIKPAEEVERQLVALHLSDGTEGLVELTNANTAMALVMILPDIIGYAKKDPVLIRDIIQSSAGFEPLVLEISTQLQDSGWIALYHPTLISLVELISDEVIMMLPQGLSSGQCLVEKSPFLEIGPGNKELIFSHCGINQTYWAQVYSLEGEALSGSIGMFLGDGHSPSTKFFVDIIGNALILALYGADSKYKPIKANLNNKMSLDQIQKIVNEPFDEFRIRLTNGWGPRKNGIDAAAKAYNKVVFLWSLLSAVSPASVFEESNQCLLSSISAFGTIYDQVVSENVINSPLDAVSVVADLGASWISLIGDCGLRPWGKAILKWASGYNLIKEAGFLTQFVYDGYTQRSEINYVFTRIDDKLIGKVNVASNSSKQFYGVPGGYVKYLGGFFNASGPLIWLEERRVYALSDEGEKLYESSSVEIDMTNHVGFKMGGTMKGTEYIRLYNKKYSGEEFSAAEISNNAFIFWKLVNSSEILPLPKQASLDLKLYYKNKEFPSYISGYEEDILSFIATAENAQITKVSGDEQEGAPEKPLEENIKVRLKGKISDQSAQDCPLRFQIKQGGGLVKALSGSSTGQEITVKTSIGTEPESGFAEVSWILGEQDTQVLEVSYWVGDVKMDSVEFTAYLSPCENLEPGTVCNPITGRIWMDRNLGASGVATSPTDAASYGGYYQWGRSTTAFTPVQDFPYDWSVPQNDNYWQGVNGLNNPCPAGFRVPTESEWEEERASWSSNDAAGAFASPLKLSLAGARFYSIGSLLNVGTNGYYWSSTISSTNSRYLPFNSSNANMSSDYRANGVSVRCLKD
jgi:uncharacterized protein (TIGR02145 family)